MVFNNPQPAFEFFPCNGFAGSPLPPQFFQGGQDIGSGQPLHVFQEGRPVCGFDAFVCEVLGERSGPGGDRLGAGEEVGGGHASPKGFLPPDDFIQYVFQTFPGGEERSPSRAFNSEALQAANGFATGGVEVDVSRDDFGGCGRNFLAPVYRG